MGGRHLQELRPYWVKNFPHQHMVAAETYIIKPIHKTYYSHEKSISRNYPVLPIETFKWSKGG